MRALKCIMPGAQIALKTLQLISTPAQFLDIFMMYILQILVLVVHMTIPYYLILIFQGFISPKIIMPICNTPCASKCFFYFYSLQFHEVFTAFFYDDDI